MRVPVSAGSFLLQTSAKFMGELTAIDLNERPVKAKSMVAPEILVTESVLMVVAMPTSCPPAIKAVAALM